MFLQWYRFGSKGWPSDFLVMQYGTGAPGQVGWAVDFLEILLKVFLGRFLLFYRPAPPKTRFATRKSKAQPVYAIKVGYLFVVSRSFSNATFFFILVHVTYQLLLFMVQKSNYYTHPGGNRKCRKNDFYN